MDFSPIKGHRAIAALAVGAAAIGLTANAEAQTAPAPVATQGILEIVGHADMVVKFVMLVLLLASVATWAILIVKRREIAKAKVSLQQDIELLSTACTLTEAGKSSYPATQEMVRIAAGELAKAGPTPSHRAIEGAEERVAVQLPIVESNAIHRMLSGTNVLASIGAISPFVGLAGTVWGIMNSFLGISASKSTSLAVVAPGIAEALLATAVGLAAAIPAVLIYNVLSRSIAGYRRLLGEAAVLVACSLSRDAERLVVEQGRDGHSSRNVRNETVASLAQAPAQVAGR